MTEAQGCRVLIVGAGRRVQNNFLPVLTCDDEFEIVGIHARRKEPLDEVCARWGVKPVYDLEGFDFRGIDVVAISIPTNANAKILGLLAKAAPHVTIVIDTPIAWNLGELRKIYPLSKKFAAFVVTEDYMNFPTFALMRDAVQDGLIGSVQAVELRNIGYLYHGLALIRSFAGFRRPVFARASGTRAGKTAHYRFASGMTAFVEGPYRQMDGSITVRGSQGVISDTQELGVIEPDYILSLERDSDGRLCGAAIHHAGAPDRVVLRRDFPLIKQMAQLDFADKSDLNLLRGCGLHQVFRSILHPDKINSGYGPGSAFYDGFISRLAERGIFRFDPFAAVGVNIVRVLYAVAVLKGRARGR
jgi:hypothetical protein